MNKFMKDLETELRKLNVSPDEIKEILEDHKEMIEAAKEEGLNDDEMNIKFGNPERIAKEIKIDLGSEKTKNKLDKVESLAVYDISEYTFIKSFYLISGLNEIEISFISSDIILCEHEGSDIQVYHIGIEDLEKFEVDLSDDKFTLKRKRNIMFGNINKHHGKGGKFLVLLPKDLKIKKFDSHTVSGDVTYNGLDVDSFKLKSTSGDINISNVALVSTKLSIVNGDINIHGLTTSSLDISLVNGDTILNKVIVDKDIYVNSVSGIIELKEVECKAASFKTVSGDMNGRNFYVNAITLTSVSGNIRIKNDDTSREIKVVSKKTLSGDININ